MPFYLNKTPLFGQLFLCRVLHRRGTLDCGYGYVAAAVWAKWNARRFTKWHAHRKTMETPRKINIFRLDLPTEDAAREKPFANVSFYLNKTHIFKINYDVAQRAHSPYQAHWAHSCRTCVPYFVNFHHPKKITCPRHKKASQICGEKTSKFCMPKTPQAKCPY